VTINTVLQGAWALLLSRYSGEKEVVFGVTVSGRSEMLAGVESMVGLFINTLPMRVPVPDEARVETWLQRMQAHQAEARTYAYTPLWHIQRWSESGGQQPLFQSLFVFENYPLNISLQELEGLVVENAVQNEQTNYPLSLIVLPDVGMLLKLGYDARLFEEATIQRMLEHYQTILWGMAEQPELPLGQLPLLSEEEYQRIVYTWNATQCAYAEDELSLCTLFEKQVERTPDASAAMFKEQRLTYRDLNARANQFAHYLHSQGMQPDVRIGICLERSLDMLVGLVAILKVGGIYVPLDPAYPADRLAFMLEDAQLAALVTRHELVERLPAHEARVICIDRDWPAITQESQENPAQLARGEDDLYMLYTSGSTGKPKGITGTQRATLNRFRWMWQTYPFAPGEVCCQKTTLNFVDAVWEIFGPLLQGIPLVIIPDQTVKDLAQFLSTLAQYRVTRIVLVPSLLRVLLQSEDDLQQRLADLKYWVCSGEALPLELARSFQQRVPQGTLINLYGSTEVAADATFYEVRPDELRSSVPIGRPIANTQVYLLDEALRPVPIGVAGELHIGGVGLARGYFKRPELTRAKFVPDPFSREPGARLYKTGDWARYLPDGTLEYLGRRDQQVKVRGIRIELGEIEAVLNEHPAINEAVVAVREDVPGDQRLVAYIVLHDAQSITASDLQRHLNKEVPASMVPGSFVFLDSFPLMPNGKVDRQALPTLTYAWSAPRTTFVAPRTPIEQALADIWQQVLHVPQVSIYDNFFDVGGDSIRAILLASRVQSLFLIDLSLRDLFEAETATIASLAEYIERARQDIQAQEEQIAQLLEQVKDLSDEEANVLLSRVADA
nr:amino acid adenylation domain-containing protein [Ktedonobacteraceae bacterium]